MAAAFSTDSQSALSKSVRITHIDHLEDEEIVLKYEIQKCVDFITHHLYKKVSLIQLGYCNLCFAVCLTKPHVYNLML